MRAITLFPLFLILQGCLENNDDEIKLGFISESYSVIEPLTGATELIIPVEIDTNDFDEKTVTVYIEHSESDQSDLTLIEDKFLIQSSTLTFDIPIHISADIYYEEPESFEVIINVDDEDDVTYSIGKTKVTITSVNPEPEVGFENSKMILSEGSGNQKIRAVVSNPFEHKGITVTFNQTGDAKIHSDEFQGDYKISANTFNILPGEQYAEIDYETLNDGLKEGSERVLISLNAPSAGKLTEINTLEIVIPGDYVLNDTGVSLFSTPSGLSSSTENSYPHQDAHSGIDANNNSDVDGLDGFSFTKIDHAGNALVSNEISFLCAEDENTGLTWEVKGPPESIPYPPAGKTFNEYVLDIKTASELDPSSPEYSAYPFFPQHANWTSASYSYYWFNDIAQTNGGHPGADGTIMEVAGFPIQATCAYPDKTRTSFSEQNRYCNIKEYVRFKNSLATCGYKNWEVPSLSQLRTIINYNPGAPIFDAVYFPYSNSGKYLSSTPSADVAGSVWCIDTSDKKAKLCNKQLPNKILLVRSVK